MFDFGEDELARLSLQASQERSQENLYEKLVNARLKEEACTSFSHPELQKRLQYFHEILQSWRTYSRRTPV